MLNRRVERTEGLSMLAAKIHVPGQKGLKPVISAPGGCCPLESTLRLGVQAGGQHYIANGLGCAGMCTILEPMLIHGPMAVL